MRLVQDGRQAQVSYHRATPKLESIWVPLFQFQTAYERAVRRGCVHKSRAQKLSQLELHEPHVGVLFAVYAQIEAPNL